MEGEDLLQQPMREQAVQLLHQQVVVELFRVSSPEQDQRGGEDHSVEQAY